jgi:hypothetical protein
LWACTTSSFLCRSCLARPFCPSANCAWLLALLEFGCLFSCAVWTTRIPFAALSYLSDRRREQRARERVRAIFRHNSLRPTTMSEEPHDKIASLLTDQLAEAVSVCIWYSNLCIRESNCKCKCLQWYNRGQDWSLVYNCLCVCCNVLYVCFCKECCSVGPRMHERYCCLKLRSTWRSWCSWSSLSPAPSPSTSSYIIVLIIRWSWKL